MWRAGKPTRLEIKEVSRFFTGGLKDGPDRALSLSLVPPREDRVYMWETRARNRVINDRVSRHKSETCFAAKTPRPPEPSSRDLCTRYGPSFSYLKNCVLN
jgi:hypothetical protein